MPLRIQRRRVKGWRMPKNAISISRPGKFGNPFTIQSCIEAGYTDNEEVARQMCVNLFREWLKHGEKQSRFQDPELIKARKRVLSSLHELEGKDLACFCKDGEPCHGDVLLEMANKPNLIANGIGMKKIIVLNDDIFSEDCDLAGYREFLFGMLENKAEIAGVQCIYENEGVLTSYPDKVLTELNSTGDWAGYPERPVYAVEK